MDLSTKKIVLILAVILTGLSAGLFYAWTVSVIPGTKKISDGSYLETMQVINRAIINPGFYLIFFGSLLLLVLSTIQQYHAAVNQSFWLLLLAMSAYFLGGFGVTILGNVPLNEMLDQVDLNNLDKNQLSLTRQGYEHKWNLFHYVRTIFSTLAFIASLLAITINK